MSRQFDTSILAIAWSRPDPGEFPERAAEYERLFVGPGPVPCPPYESFWREDVPSLIRATLMGPCTTQLVTLYGALGLQLKQAAAELPDHVAVELEALSVAQARADRPDIAAALVTDHLAVWLPPLCEAVLAASTFPYYRSLASATSRWVTELARSPAPCARSDPGPP